MPERKCKVLGTSGDSPRDVPFTISKWLSHHLKYFLKWSTSNEKRLSVLIMVGCIVLGSSDDLTVFGHTTKYCGWIVWDLFLFTLNAATIAPKIYTSPPKLRNTSVHAHKISRVVTWNLSLQHVTMILWCIYTCIESTMKYLDIVYDWKYAWASLN